MVKSGHLDERQIIEAAVDETSLEETARVHLRECPACRAQIGALAGKLARFGRMTVECSPPLLKSPRLSEREPRALRLRWGVRPMIGMGLAAASILVLMLSPMAVKRGKAPSIDKVYKEMLQDAQFMSEIKNLEDNPLPRFLVDISDPDGAAEQDSGLSGGHDERLT